MIVAVSNGVVSRVTLSEVPEGVAVTGRTTDGRHSWRVVSAAPSYAFVDPLAPLGVPFFYEAGGVTSDALIRSANRYVYAAFTSLDGNSVVPFIMPHEWEDTDSPEVAEFQAGGRVMTVHGRCPRTGRHEIQARVAGRDIVAMRALVAANEPVAFLHAPCPLPECPVPPALTGAMAAAPGSVTARKDVGEMVYGVSFLPKEIRRPVPAVSWGDVAASHVSWGDVAAEHATWADVRDGG